jgi:hypothetical protein
MRHLGLRFTIRSMIFAVALVAFNLAAAIATWNGRSEEPPQTVGRGPRVGPFCESNASRRIRLDFGMLATGERLVRIVTRPLPPNPAEVWAPVIASLSITLLAFVVPLGSPGVRRPSTASIVDCGRHARLSRLWRVARWLAIATALIGLNFAGAVYRPLRGPGELRPSPYLFFDSATFLDEHGDFLLQHPGGRLFITKSDGGCERPALPDDCEPPPLESGSPSRIRDSIVNKTSGSIVAYEVRPGLMRLKLSRPRSVKSSMRSFVEVWFPAIASASVTALVLYCMWRQVRRERNEVVAVRHMRAAPAQD